MSDRNASNGLLDQVNLILPCALNIWSHVLCARSVDIYFGNALTVYMKIHSFYPKVMVEGLGSPSDLLNVPYDVSNCIDVEIIQSLAEFAGIYFYLHLFFTVECTYHV